MAQDLCDPADLFAHGLPRGGVPNHGRQVSAVDTTANTLTIDLHGLSLDDEVEFRAEGGGTLPTGISAATIYYAIPVTYNTFSVSATLGGSAVNISASGTPGRILCIPKVNIPAIISGTSRLVEDMLPAHIVPIVGDVPPIVRQTTAELAAQKVLALTGGATASLMTIFDLATKRLERWARGVPVRGDGGQQQASGATSASLPYEDARGWTRHGGL